MRVADCGLCLVGDSEGGRQENYSVNVADVSGYCYIYVL